MAYIGLGANLGDARQSLTQALDHLGQVAGIKVLRCSPFFRSAPVEAQGPDFVNAVAELQTDLSPEDLLQAMWGVEQAFGRERPYHHAPRTLDLDLLWMAGESRNTPTLTLPHPRLHQRAFVLRPWLALCPDLMLPHLGERLSTLAERVAGQDIEVLPS